MGHELTHGFDDEGRQFDAKGNLSDWWTPDGRHGVREARRVRREAVRRLRRRGRHSTSTASSRSARTSPISAACKLAYAAMKKELARKPRGRRPRSRPSSSSSSAFAQAWCSKLRPEFAELMAQDQPALAAALPRQRARLEPAGVRPGLPVQARRADGPEGSLRGLVAAQPIIHALAGRPWSHASRLRTDER